MEASELHDAISGRMVEARYQPIVRLSDGLPVAVETLVRLNHPTLGTLTPDLFVPQVESAGLGELLTETVARVAFTDMTSTLATAHLLLTLNFPLDVLLLARNVERLDASRERAGLAAGRIVLELTESRPVNDLHALGVAIERIRRAGYGLALDDVAPTVPHHQAMMDMPFTAMKLDKSVVQEAGRDPDVKAFVVKTIASAKARGLLVIAEGVEEHSIWTNMRDLGADEAQGFFVAHPMAFTALPYWLKSWADQPGFA